MSRQDGAAIWPGTDAVENRDAGREVERMADGRMSGDGRIGEPYRDAAGGRRLMSLDGRIAALHPGVIVRRGGSYVHYRREGAGVVATAVSEEDLAAPRESVDGFVPAVEGARPDGQAPELSGPGADLDAVEKALRDEGLAASAEAYRRLLEAKDGDLDPPPCPECGGEMRRYGPGRPKTFTTRLGKVTVTRSYCRCSRCGRGLSPLDAWLGLEGRSMTPGAERMVMAVAAETGSRRGSRLVEELSGVRTVRARLDRQTRTLGAELVDSNGKRWWRRRSPFRCR